MNLVFKCVKIIDPNGKHHGQTVDLHLENGVLQHIGNVGEIAGAQVIEWENVHASVGWFDTSVCLGEPGFEDRETIANGLSVAARSGFTGVAVQPNTFPVTDGQSQVQLIQYKAQGSLTGAYPIGALTKNSEGLDLAELYDMKNAGAVAFGDYNKSLANANLLKIALQYTQDFDALVIAYSQDDKIKGTGVVNEGIVSTRLGLKGIPHLAESIVVARNLYLLEYTGGKLHLPTVSTPESIALIRQAKAKGLDVTCSVAVHHLVMTDEKLDAFDSRHKVTPPLRTESDRKQLLEAVLDGTIDLITTDHNPIDIEHKKMEFDLAKNGTIGLESAFGALCTVLPVEVVIEKLTAGRKRFGIAAATLEQGALANLTLFNPAPEWTFSTQHIQSKSKNSAFLGQSMKGKVYAAVHNGKIMIND